MRKCVLIGRMCECVPLSRVCSPFLSLFLLLTDLVVLCGSRRRQNQNTYLDRLTTLLQRKAEVERQLVRHTQDLAELCTTATEEFEAVIKGRSDDVDGAIEDLESVVTDAEGGKQQARDHSS